MKQLIMLLVGILLLSTVMPILAQEKKKSKSMDMSDFSPASKPAEQPTTKATESKPATPAQSSTPTTPAQPSAPADIFTGQPEWVMAQKALVDGYFKSQEQGQSPDPYFYYGNSATGTFKPDQRPVNMVGLYGYKIVGFEGEFDGCLWKVSVDAPVGRSSTAGTWFIYVKPRAGGEGFAIFSMARTNNVSR